MVGSEGGEYISEKDGYSFIVPRGVLDSDVTITHGIVPFEEVSQYEFPEKIIPLSSIVSICPDQSQECFSMEISFQHCINLKNPEDTDAIILLKAHHDDFVESMDKRRWFEFQKVKDANIFPSQNPNELTAHVTHCCAFCFGSYVTEKDTADAVRFYLIELKPNVTNEKCWKVEYCLSHVFETCMGVCSTYYNM